jgi:hypothetical protein
MGRAKAPTAKSVVRVREFSDLGLKHSTRGPICFNQSDGACQTGYFDHARQAFLDGDCGRRLSETHRDDLLVRKSGSLHPSGHSSGPDSNSIWRKHAVAGQMKVQWQVTGVRISSGAPAIQEPLIFCE